MKKYTLFTLLLLLAGTLAAQTGLLGLSFGDTRDAALAKLDGQGFEISLTDSAKVELTGSEESTISSVEVRFSREEDALVQWTVVFGADPDLDLEEYAVDMLIALHGDDFDYDPELEEFYWPIEYDCEVFAYYDWFYEDFIVEYVSADAYE